MKGCKAMPPNRWRRLAGRGSFPENSELVAVLPNHSRVGVIPRHCGQGRRAPWQSGRAYDAIRMFDNSIAFYQAENGVWLTDVIPVEYLGFDSVPKD